MAESERWKRTDDMDDEEEEEVSEDVYKSTKDAVLFLIDINSSMLTPPPPSGSKKADTDTPAMAALKCAYHLMQQRIISHPNDMMGVLLFGTEKTKLQELEGESQKRHSYPHCYLLIDLDVPEAADVKNLKRLVENEEEAAELLVPSTEPVSMANVLFCSNQIFTAKASNFSSRRLFIVTDNDNPHAKDKTLRSAAIVRAKDLYDLGVVIELFPIFSTSKEFDKSKFYDDIIYRTAQEDPDALASLAVETKPSSSRDGISLLNSLISNITSRVTPRRALFRGIPFEIGPGFNISVNGYIYFKQQVPARSCYVWLNGEKAQIAKGITTQMAEDTGRTVDKSEIKKAFKFGGEQVLFSPEEFKELRNFGEPVIRIIGFKPQSMLPFWASLKYSTFIYPTEGDYIGSTRVFSALYQKLLKDKKIALVWFIARKNAAPVIAALLPGTEKRGDLGEQTMPPGMWIIPIPFADDIRPKPEVIHTVAQDSLIDKMRIVVQQLQLPKAQYDPLKYPNPALQWHYRILQAMALEEDLPEQPEDKTIPKYRQITKRAQEYIMDWGVELDRNFRANQESDSPAIGTKRAASSSRDQIIKRPKKEADDTASDIKALSDSRVRALIKTNSLGKLTRDELRTFLEAKGQNTQGRKAVLTAKVEELFK